MRLLHEQFKALSIVSSLIVTAGLVLMFSSVSLGFSLGESWLVNQENGMVDTSQYNMVVHTYKNNFVIIGSILFGAGVLSLIFIYFTYIFSRKNENNNPV